MYQQISNIENWDNATKRYYKEKIEIFIKLVSAVSKKEGIQIIDKYDDSIIPLFVEIGFIKAKSDLNSLRRLVGNDAYETLMKCGMTVVNSRIIFDSCLQNLNESYRKKRQEMAKESTRYSVVDLFCGAGGLSLGFIQEGCKVVFANDMDDLCIETYKYNHPEIPEDKVVCGDIKQIVDNIEDHIDEEVDIVIGGPPCQGFSSANKHHRVINDPRNELYKYYIKAIQRLAPKIVVMENVRGMLRVADQVVEDYESISIRKGNRDLGYKIAFRLLNSASFSVAQSRERLIYIAIRDDVVEKSGITPEDIFKSLEEKGKKSPRYNLSSALEGIRSLEPPETMGVGEIDSEEAGRKIDVNKYEKSVNEYIDLINSGRTIPLVFNHKARYCSPINHEIYRRLEPGDDATNSKIADIMPYAHRNDKFKDKYYKLQADKPCRTITAHLRSDCHSHIHPVEARTLTPREAARVQSFPDDYFFLGPYLKTYIQIGNAVPPLMAKGIAHELTSLLNGINNEN